MNIHQQHLLKLLKEVDVLCREHGITYYCAGGTVIGAARHHGFIPWDDDIDIYMTRENFAKFAAVLEQCGPDNRKLEYYEADHDRRAPVPRYHRDTDTMFCHFHLLGRSCAGTSLDVFILDPIPDGHDARIEYFAHLYAYSDLIAPCHVYSHRLPISKFDIYDKYKKIADEEGTARAVELISEKIFRYDIRDCGCYCLRWGSVPLIYPKEALGEPVYLPFEDMEIPVPCDWYRYLAVHYGMEWMILPYEEVQHEHVNILDYDRRYDWLYEKRDELYDQDELLDIHFRWKEAERRFYRAAEPVEQYVKELRDRICRAETDRNAGEYFLSTDTPGSASSYRHYDPEALISMYKPYLELQLSNAYMGSRMRHGTQFRYLFPRVVPLKESELGALLKALVETGRERTAEKLTGIYERADIRSAAIDEAAGIIDLINRARGMYYRGEYAACLDEISSAAGAGKRSEDIPALSDLRWLCLAQKKISNEEAELLEAAAGSDVAREAVRKAYGDLLWNRGDSAGAEAVYRELMNTCRNGLFWLDIQSRIPDIEPIPTKRLTPFNETALTRKQRELLEEIAGICDKNGIKYVLSPDLARRIHLTGNIGYANSNREIFMDAANAAKFMKAFDACSRADRKLMSWAAGDSVHDFALIYSDTGNVYCDFRRLGQWRDMGIFITIRILRSSVLPKAQKRRAMLYEFYLNIANIEGVDRRNLQSAAKKLTYSLSRVMSASGRKRLGKKVFARSMRMESAAAGTGDLYYYTNTRGMKPVRHKLARRLWDETCTAEMNGVAYNIPSAMTAEYVENETDRSNVPPIDSIFIYRSDGMSWGEISPLIDDDAYAALDWDGYASTRRRFRKIDKEVRDIWQTMLELDPARGND